MNDQIIALIVGAATVIALRVVDWFLPKGWISRWARDHGVRDDDEEPDDADR